MSSYLGVLRHHNFRYLFLGQAASAIGDQVVVVALALFITQRTGSPTDLGLVLGAQSLTLVALLLFGGVWGDRGSRRRIMIFTDGARCALHAAVAVLIFSGAVAVWQLVVIEALFGAARAFFQPAYTGLLPQTVPEPLIQDARALTESMTNVAMLVGPALATVLVLGLGAGEAFAFDAVTFLLSALLLVRVRPRSRGVPAAQASVLESLRGGWREVRSRTWVWVIIGVFAGAVLCVYSQWYSLAPRISRDLYGSAGVFGWLETATGVGAVCGAVLGFRWRPARPLRAGMLLTLAWPLLNATLAVGSPAAVVAVFAFATGLGFALLMIWWETALAQHIPANALSRVSAWDWMGSLALMPLGFALAGPLAATLGARNVLGVGSVIGLGLLLLGLVPRSVRQLRPKPSAQQFAGEVRVRARGKAQVPDVDALVGVMDEG